MKKSLLSLVILLILAGLAQGQRNAPYLFDKTNKKGTSKAAQDRSVVKGMSVIARLGLLAANRNERYRLQLPDGKEITIRRRRVEREKKAQAWYGTVENEKASFVFFASTAKAMNGRIEIGNRHYRVIYLGNGVHQIDELDVNKMREADDDGEAPKYGKPRDRSDEDGCPDPASDIDLMVVYTQHAENGAGGPEGMEALIYESVFLTNLAYENSDINQRLRLVHFSRVDYAESGDTRTDREHLTNPTDGSMDGIHALRDAHGADLVMLITETAEICGRAWIMNVVSADHEAFGFGVVTRECSADNLSFPHELAHIMSARHHDDNRATPFPFNRGFVQPRPSDGSSCWQTIMSKQGGCVRQKFFSNPDLEFSPTGAAETDPMGIADERDNHRTLNSTAETVANFRCSSPGVGNVWMKDTWDDTGVEPDPATAGQRMFRSPYVWIRNAQDPTFLHQHEHQNPVFGATNFIYVKTHNGGEPVQRGNLELHIADASVSLTWPTSWTRIASIPLELRGHETRVVEHEWNSVPDPRSGSTHYCLIARWVSETDPMHTPEGEDIGTNVRENNNIVWRNLNIVVLEDDADNKVVMNIAGNKRRVPSRIVFADLTKFPRPKFTSSGKITVTFDDKLLALAKKSKGKSNGLRSLGKNTFELTAARAWLDNVWLPADYKGKITVTFRKGFSTSRSKYNFSVGHYLMDKKAPYLLGGVDYELVHRKK